MRFKCEQNPYLPKSPVLSASPPVQLQLSPPQLQLSPPLRHTPATAAKDGFIENNVSPRNSVSGSSGSEQTPPSSPLDERRAVKRKPADDTSGDVLNLVKREINHNHMTQSELTSLKMTSPRFAHASLEVGETHSAFHKVSKVPPMRNNNDVRHAFVHPMFSPTTSQYRFPALQSASNQLHANLHNLHNIQMKMHARQATKENIPDAIPPTNALPLKNREDLRNLINCGKMPFHPDWRFQFPYIKSQNPIVENLLTAAATLTLPAPLTQNWCAKCNATFRMTSDLVYHMRSHHKEETHKTKVKPMEKLRCDVCGDRFKERHHLTRHMTSHQDV